MKLKESVNQKAVVSGLLIALGAAVFFCVFNHLDAVNEWFHSILYYIAPVTEGLALAYLLRPIAKFMEKRFLKKVRSEKARVHISSLTTVFLLLVILVFLSSRLIPQIMNSVTSFAANSEDYFNSAKQMIADYASRVEFLNLDVDRVLGTSEEMFEKISRWVADNSDLFIQFIYHLGSQIMNFIIVIAMASYALLDRKNIKRGLLKLENALLGESKSNRLNEVLSRGDALMTGFLGSNLVDAIIIGVTNFIFLSICKAPYKVLLSVFLGITNYIPTFGPIFGGILAGVVVLLTKPSILIVFIIFTVVLQQLDGNVIKPLLFGDSSGLSPFWVLVAIIVGGRMFGVLGMVLGVPVCALIFSIYEDVLNSHIQKKNE